MKTTILITERFALHAELELKQNPSFNVLHPEDFYKLPKEALLDVEALIIRSQTKVNQALLERFPKLKFIVTATAGFDHIDLKLCHSKQITVSHCPDAHTDSASELTWSLILALTKNLQAARQQMKMGNWNRQTLLGTELAGKTLGVVGLGRIGQKVARIAKAFDMQVLANDPYQEDEAFEKLGLERLSLEEVLRGSDIVTLHVPLTKETNHMMGEMFIESMRDHSLIINTCRGPVIHEQALIKALDAKKLAGAGLDVFEYEPLDKHSTLLKLSNVVLTPHIGATTEAAFIKASQEAALKVSRFFEQQPVSDLLPGSAAWYALIP